MFAKIDNIILGESILSDLIKKILKDHHKIFLITDENLKIYLNLFPETIFKYIIPPGEGSKKFDTVFKILDFLIINKATRDSLLIAFGGGVVGDITGFTASIFKRGIKLIQIPTTLLAQIDSSIGGKTGINYKNIKNIIGTFYPAEKVIIDINFLKTLPEKEFINGLGEVVKYGIIKGNKLWNFLIENHGKILSRDETSIFKMVYSCIKTKIDIVKQDPFDNKDIRIFLNLGHTIGHAVESSLNYNITHGEAVAIGIGVISEISNKVGLLSNEEKENILNLLKRFNLPYEIPKRINLKELNNKIAQDKKNTSQTKKIVLIKRVGELLVRPYKSLDLVNLNLK